MRSVACCRCTLHFILTCHRNIDNTKEQKGFISSGEGQHTKWSRILSALLDFGGDQTCGTRNGKYGRKQGRKESESKRKLIGVNGNIPPRGALSRPRTSPVPDIVLIKYCTKLAVVRVSHTLPNPKFKCTPFNVTSSSNSTSPSSKKFRWFNLI